MVGLTGFVEQTAFVENVTSPGDTNSGQTEWAEGNKVYRAILTGKAFNAGFISAAGGTFTFDNGSLDLWSGRVRKEWVMDPVTEPGDAGVSKFEEGAITYSASLLGTPQGNVFTASTTSVEGTLTVKVNSTGEQISGESFVRSLTTRPDWTRGGVIPTQLGMVWKNDAAITSGTADMFAAAVDGTLTVVLGDGDGSAGVDFQQLTGAAKLKRVDYLFDFRTGLPVSVEMEAFWNSNPVS